MKVRSELGFSMLESTYERALMIELKNAGFPAERQVSIPVFYNGETLNHGYAADIIVDNRILLELKAASRLYAMHRRQIQFYLSKIAVLENDWTAAFYGYLHAAWASERHYFDEPSEYRKEALAVLKGHFTSLAIPGDDRYILFADLCRRTGDFASVTALKYQSGDDTVNRILAFQKELAKKHDIGVYRVDAVISPDERDSDVQVMRVTFEDIFGTDEGSGGRV